MHIQLSYGLTATSFVVWLSSYILFTRGNRGISFTNHDQPINSRVELNLRARHDRRHTML